MKILCVIGTRPEAIKMSPLIILLKKDKRFNCEVCTTSQHREMLLNPLNYFGISADYNLDIMQENQSVFDISINILVKIESIFLKAAPDLILVQGDTTTAFIAALAGFYSKIQVGHIEAGLRTFKKDQPFPEEINRQLISRIADFHFAPTQTAKQNLIAENIPEPLIHVTGNTVIDALRFVLKIIHSNEKEDLVKLFPEISTELWSHLNKSSKKIILVTLHRHENFEKGIANVCKALKILSHRKDIIIVIPVHPNPKVKIQIENELLNVNNICLTKPFNYFTFVYLMSICKLIITDSGGIQEEAPYLGKPILIARESTERKESIDSGNALLVDTDMNKILYWVNLLLDNENEYQKLAIRNNMFGDGKASEKIVDILVAKYKL